ncbi:TRAP transporter substrate-binding protein DctP [Georgenia sp. 10Sc9-8]|uniref:TRAP transporter substrate-binding protein DctP n=1 Tax=Georgenia halotolerans TaxID=3028317 RepID=A0ABT5TZ53_9MICO|nr:TRAP transporter substrate-binding protein DctP [Georgenia halotolerans]
MRRKLNVGVVAAGAGALLLVAACGGNGGEAGGEEAGGEEEVQWDLQGALAADHWWAGVHESFAEELDEASDGTFEVTVHAGGSLGIPPAEVLEYVRSGRADLIENTPSYTSGAWHDSLIDSQQMLYPDYEAARDGWGLLRDEFDSELRERFNAKLLYGGPSDGQIIFTSQRVESLEDLSGSVLRVSSEAQAALFNSLPGVSATVLPSADTYTALERGTVDGVVSTTTNTEASSWDEVVDYAVVLPVNFAFVFTAVNLDSYEALSEEHREAIDDAAALAEEEWSTAGEEASQAALERLEEAGTVEFVEPDPEFAETLLEVARPQWDAWAEQGSPQAREWLDMLIAEGFPEDYMDDA